MQRLTRLTISVCAVLFLVTVSTGAARVRLVVDASLTPAARHAVDRLAAALKQRQIDVAEQQKLAADGPLNIVIGDAGSSSQVDKLLADHRLLIDEKPESLLIKRIDGAKPPVLLLAGRDQRGLVYAVLEAAEAIRLAPAGDDPLAAVHDASESPHLPLRSISVHLFNFALDRRWYFSEDYWHEYFTMLSKHRYNTFILTFADQTNYMAPPFPWLFDMPGFDDVHVEGLSQEDQAKNYRMLQRITELAAEHGLDFKLSIWQQKPVQDPGIPPGPSHHNYGPTPLRNLPTGDKLIEYNTKSLSKVLRECPKISGLQLRINDESGIEESQQHAYFSALFDAIKNCGHPVALELRYKGLKPETIAQANTAGLDLTISTKFWCEHMGLPYHPAEQDPIYSPSRYGYGTLHSHPRTYRVSYQLWNQGSAKLFLWGDPTYASRFAESCRLGDGRGFEIFAPLTNRGWGNEPGTWSIYTDEAFKAFRQDYERYWIYFLTFGRMGYNPQATGDVWQREMTSRFGKAASDVEVAYRSASQILPLLTVVNQMSASEWAFWPEFDTCGPLPAYAAIQPSDHAQFYPIRRFRGGNGWTTDNWSSNHAGFVEHAMADSVEAKWTPIQISRRLTQLADETTKAIDRAGSCVADPKQAEFRAMELDFRALVQLARYHAAKKLAATELEFFAASSQAGRLPLALEHIKLAAASWEELVRLTDGPFHADLNFGQRGPRHWKGSLPEVRDAVDYVAKLAAQHNTADQIVKRFPGEEPPQDLPRIKHQAITTGTSDGDVEIVADVESTQPLRQVLVHFRTMNQTVPWKRLPMQRRDDGRYTATISSHEITQQYDMLYYLEARVSGGGTLWPNWTQETPYVVISIARSPQTAQKTP